MKISTSALLVIFSSIVVSTAVSAETIELQTEKDKVSYSVGHQIGSDFKKQGVELNEEAMLQGVKDGLEGGEESLMSAEEMQATLIALKKRIEADGQDARKAEIAANIAEGKKFLNANAQKEGTIVLENGLQYRVLKEGSGPTPEESDTVEALYTTTLIDGTKIGGSKKTFKVANTISGLKQALLLMPEGAHWQIVIPHHLAFGEEPNTNMAGKTMIFDMELLKIEK